MMLLPADSYFVVNKSIISDIDKKIIIDLYQPIIGHNAVCLYYTLLNDLEKSNIISTTYNHHHLLSIMQLSLSDIKVAREKLLNGTLNFCKIVYRHSAIFSLLIPEFFNSLLRNNRYFRI